MSASVLRHFTDRAWPFLGAIYKLKMSQSAHLLISASQGLAIETCGGGLYEELSPYTDPERAEAPWE